MNTGTIVVAAQDQEVEVAVTVGAVVHLTVHVQTGVAPHFCDITDTVAACVRAAGTRTGLLTVFCRHTTAGLCINEHEPLLVQDMAEFLTRLAPPGRGYRHDDFSVRTVNMNPDERPNAHAHCQQLLLNSSESIPVANGALVLGRWQRLFIVELDCPRLRELSVCIIGSV